MMWSQCTCDMKTFTVAGRPPWRARMCSLNARAPLPMSQTKYSSLPGCSSTHDVWPPKVWVTENGSCSCAKAYASPKDSNRRPPAATGACASLSRMSTGVRATGIEPRVPQKRTRTRLAAVEGFRGLRRNRDERLAQGGKHLEHQVEPADLEDFRHHGLHRSDHHARALRRGLGFLGREHQAAQPGARDVLEPREVEDQRFVLPRAGFEVRREIGAEGLAVVVVETAPGRERA